MDKQITVLYTVQAITSSSSSSQLERLLIIQGWRPVNINRLKEKKIKVTRLGEPRQEGGVCPTDMSLELPEY